MPPTQPKPVVFWAIWLAILNGVIVLQFTLGKGIPLGSNSPDAPSSPIAAIGLATIILATVVRWFLIPRTDEPPKLLVLMVVGLALSEAPAFFGMFVIPQSQPEPRLALLAASLLSILQFAPFYVNRPKSYQNEFHRE